MRAMFLFGLFTLLVLSAVGVNAQKLDGEVPSIIEITTTGGYCRRGDCVNGYGTFQHTPEVWYTGHFTNRQKNGVGVAFHISGLQVLQVWKEGRLLSAEISIMPQKKGGEYMGGYTPAEYDYQTMQSREGED